MTKLPEHTAPLTLLSVVFRRETKKGAFPQWLSICTSNCS